MNNAGFRSRCTLLPLLATFAFASIVHADSPADITTVATDLTLPPISAGDPAPGKRVLLSLPSYAGTDVKHALYLPTDWERGKTYPVIVEYAGNTRTVADGSSCMGYGISGGKGFIWLCLPYVSADRKRDMDLWWGDVEATVAYAKEAVPAICKQWGGDPNAVILTGHSRGAIACNYIGLHDDEIAKLWRAMAPCSHYDNGIYKWGMSKEEQAACAQRLRRLGAIPQFISGEYHMPVGHSDKKLLDAVKERKFDSFEKAKEELKLTPLLTAEQIESFVTTNYPQGNYTFVNLPFVNHTAGWVLRDIPERKMLREWVQKILQSPPGQAAASQPATKPRQIDPALPAMEADVVVVGGSIAAVSAACAAEGEANVILIAPRPYLGDDLCGKQHLWLNANETPQSELAKSLFPNGPVTTPLIVKTALDQALLRRGVRFITGSYASELLMDEQGKVSGVVMVNRSGSQAIKAKIVIDATRHATVARQAGAKFREFVPGEKEFRFIVVGGELKSGPGFSGRAVGVTYKNPSEAKKSEASPVFEYTARIPIKNSSFAEYAKAEHLLRNMVCDTTMKDCSEYAYAFPEDTIVGTARMEDNWPGVDKCDIGTFRPAGIDRLYVLSEYADMGVKAQMSMTRPVEFIAIGEKVGKAAATEAKQLARPREAKAARRALPVIGEYDVVVVGGGTSGAPAGIGAARGGAKTLVVEYLDELGGVGTAGLISTYWYGLSGGFTQEIDEAIGIKRSWKIIEKAEWLRRELLKNNAEVWFNSFGCGAVVEGGKVCGVVVATPFGCGVVKAKTVIDSTGNSDIAHAAGAATQFTLSPDGMLSVQLAGYPKRNLGDNQNNTCFVMIDDTNARDVWHLMTWMRASADANKIYDLGQLVDSRERRRIVADYMLTTMDILNQRTFPDTISQHRSNFDAAAFPTSHMLWIKDMKGPAFQVDLPYRSLLPKGVDGLLVTGLGAGADRDAMTLVRMQPDLQNQGYAAGAAAAMAATNGGHTRNIDIKQLQRQLITKGVLAEKVYTDKDSYPMSAQAIQNAVANVRTMRSEIRQGRTVEDPSIFCLSVIMAHPAEALPLLQKAYGVATTDEKVTYAKILGILGDSTGAATLVAAVNELKAWDKGYALTGDREKNNTFSELDRLVIALGCSKSPEGLDAIVAKMNLLNANSEMSHFNAVAIALRHYDHPKTAVAPLVRLLNEPGFAGHALTSPVVQKNGKGDIAPRVLGKDLNDMNAALRELLVAGMLFSCGDSQDMGRKILEQYSRDVQGHFARYAQNLLESVNQKTPPQ